MHQKKEKYQIVPWQDKCKTDFIGLFDFDILVRAQ